MNVTAIGIENIRNHVQTGLKPARGVNVLAGGNGMGKTSVLEAISLCALSKSFVPCPDAALIRRSCDYFLASVEARTDLDTPYKVHVQLSGGEGKRISNSLGKRITPRELIGELPVIILSPDHRGISAGPPAERRRLMDSVLAQASRRYSDESIRLKKVLRQRNALLYQGRKQAEIPAALIEPWTESLISAGTEIVLRRAAFIRTFSDYVRAACTAIAGAAEDVTIAYRPHGLDPELFRQAQLPDEDSLHKAYRREFQRREREERRRGVSLTGPHKDDVDIFVNNGLARECASQGQHKTLLIGFKLAEFAFLRDMRNETPLVLLDDIFSELDGARAARVLELMQSDAQTFVTTTDRAVFDRHFSGGGHHALFTVENGVVNRAV